MGSTGIHRKPMNHPPAIPYPPEARRSSRLTSKAARSNTSCNLADSGPKVVNEQMI